MKTRPYAILLLALFTLLAQQPEATEPYQLGSEDLLELRFFEKPELNTQTRIGLDGTITLDIIGRIDAAGKTTDELQSDIVRKISRLDADISQAVVRVIQYNYNHVYLTGEVNKPGKLSFEAIPDLWSLINEAGGYSAIADLTRVTIVRGGADSGRVEIVNVNEAIANGTLNSLPKIRRLDTVELPPNMMGLPSSSLGQSGERKNIVYVIGAVNAPGAISFEESTDILKAIAMAGGPAGDADLEDARLITGDGRYAQTMKINLNDLTKTGRPAKYSLRREDVIFLPTKPPGGFFRSGMGTVVSVLGAVTSAILIYATIRSNNVRNR